MGVKNKLLYLILKWQGFGWGNITVTWGTYVRYVQLQLPLYHYEGFAVSYTREFLNALAVKNACRLPFGLPLVSLSLSPLMPLLLVNLFGQRLLINFGQLSFSTLWLPSSLTLSLLPRRVFAKDASHKTSNCLSKNFMTGSTYWLLHGGVTLNSKL